MAFQDDNTAVAPPPELMAQAAIPPAPPNSPSVAAKSVQNAPSTFLDDYQKYDQALDNQDANALTNLAKTSKDPKIINAANASLQTLTKNAPFAQHMSKLDPSTADGRIQIAETASILKDREKAKKLGWSTVEDNPQVGDALLRFVLGDKQGAIKSIMGGNIQSKTEFDDNGTPLIVNVNELGQTDSVFDAKTGRMLSREEYYARGGSRPLDQTLARITEVQKREQFLKDYMSSQKNYNESEGVLNKVKEISELQKDLADNFHDLTNDQRIILAGFTSGNMAFSKSLSNMINALDQAGMDQGVKVDSAEAKKLGGELGNILGGEKGGPKGPLTLQADGSWQDSAGTRWSANTLKNKLTGTNFNSAIDQNYKQTREDMARQMRAAGMTDPRKLAALDTFLDLDAQKQKLLSSNMGKLPSFISVPGASNIEDQAARMKLNALGGIYAQKQMEGFQKFRDRMYELETSKNSTFVPEPGRYEAQWVKQPEYIQMTKDFRELAKQELAKKPVFVEKEVLPANLPTGQIEAKTSAGIAPPPEIKGGKSSTESPSANQAKQIEQQKRLQAEKQMLNRLNKLKP